MYLKEHDCNSLTGQHYPDCLRCKLEHDLPLIRDLVEAAKKLDERWNDIGEVVAIDDVCKAYRALEKKP